MHYGYSNTDKRNLKWFKECNTATTLVEISLTKGHLRGLHPFDIKMEYPISAIAGVNGSGKSTFLSMAACAFHNVSDDFQPPLSRRPYYTFRDFFVQTSNDSPVEGVTVWFGIRFDNWYRKEPGLGYQKREKRKGGKWNNYRARVNRNVLYFGVQRVVPHYERSAHKSYRSRFTPGNLAENTRKQIASIASRVFERKYNEFDSYEHFKYRLPQVSTTNFKYSGFNMGAGETSVFDILAALFQSGPGTLVIIDEIELGLHETAQRRFIDELKKLCAKLQCQVICSTHSPAVLNSLPPEGRFYIENLASRTIVYKGISAEFACGKMGGEGVHELDIFVEDDVGRAILEALLPLEERSRVKIIPIGSHRAVLRQLTSRYLEDRDNCICVLDGDQEHEKKTGIKGVIGYGEASTEAEKEKLTSWATERMMYFPGDTWPEKWLLDTSITWLRAGTEELPTDIVDEWGLPSTDELIAVLERASPTYSWRALQLSFG